MDQMLVRNNFDNHKENGEKTLESSQNGKFHDAQHAPLSNQIRL
jgi:hypothetical protein